MKILLVGGGTLGSVTPLLAVSDFLRRDDARHEFLFVGTPNGPERILAREANLPFRQIMAPKLDRFLAARFLAIPFLFAIAILQSIVIILRFRPEAMV